MDSAANTSLAPEPRATGSRVAELEGSLRAAHELQDYFADEHRRASAELAEASGTIDRLKADLAVVRARLDAQQRVIEELKERRGSLCLPDETRDAVATVLSGSYEPEDALLCISTLFPTRLTVLESAWESARASDSFNRPELLLDLLLRLVTSYWEFLASGAGDTEARKVFGKSEYAGTESETVMQNAGARRRRTFLYGGRDVEMFSHLKLGAKDSPHETMRVHFHWDARAQRIVVGHCGPHLDFS